MENLLKEAFQRLNLLEDDFDFSTVDKDKIDELKEFVADDVDLIPEEPIIDVEASDESELADNYIGKIILECECCHARIYKEEEDIIIDEESGLANAEEKCPVCNNTLGYSVIGKIEAFDADKEIKPEEDDEVEAPENDDLEDEEAPNSEESEEEKDESLKSLDKASDDSKKIDEAVLPLKDRLARKHLANESIENSDDPDYLNGQVDKVYDDLITLAQEAEYAGAQKLSKAAEEAATQFENQAVNEELLDHGNENLGVEGPAVTKDDLSLEDDQTELVHAAEDDIKPINEGKCCEDDVCPECGKNPCICEDKEIPDPWGGKEIEEALTSKEEWWGQTEVDPEEFAKEFNLSAEKLQTKGDETLWKFSGKQADFDKAKEAGYFYSDDYDESLTESVEVHADGESKVDVIKNDDGSLSVNVSEDSSELPPEEFEDDLAPVEPEGEEIVPLDTEEQAAIEANEPEDELGEEPFGDEFSEEPVEEPVEEVPEEEQEEENEEPFESLEATGKPAINEGKEEVKSSAIQDKIDKEALKQMKIETKMMQLDLDAKKAELGATEPVENIDAEVEDDLGLDADAVEKPEEPVEDEVQESLTTSIESGLLEDIEEFNENTFNSICESYLKRVYSNVESFTTSSVSMGSTKAIVEGIINFTSGNSKNTEFIFTNPSLSKRGKVVLEGYNKTLSESTKAFTLKCNKSENCLVAESMIYNYTSKQINESNEQELVKIYGRVKA